MELHLWDCHQKAADLSGEQRGVLRGRAQRQKRESEGAWQTARVRGEKYQQEEGKAD